jgi:hypothetical protein
MLLFALLAPAMVCASPDQKMTVAERACCREMKMACRDMDMPASHGCCHKDMRAAQTPALHKSTAALRQPSMTVVAELSVSASLLAPRSSVVSLSPFDTSPHQSPPSAMSVLRI